MSASYEGRGSVAVITMNNPPVNGLGFANRVGIADGLTKAAADPAVQAVASLRSLVMRAGEALALRLKVVELLHRTRLPLIVMGDLNDSPHSVTTQLIAATSQAAYDKGARDSALYSAWDVQGEGALRRDVAFSHIHQGYPEVLDQVLVSEEFVATSRRAIGDVRRVEVFNDHLFEGRDRSRSDHGFVRALLRWRDAA